MAGYASAKAVASLETTRQWIETRQQADSSSRPNTDEGPQFLATVWILTIVATIFIVLRVYCKITGHKKLWWDDYVLAASWVRLCPPLSPPLRDSLLSPLSLFSYFSLFKCLWAGSVLIKVT